MIENTDHEEILKMREYWLETLPEAEIYSLENDWFGDDEKMSQLEAERTDLIDDFLQNRLESAEKHAFEQNFLADPANLDLVALTKSVRKTINEKTVLAFDSEMAQSSQPTLWQRLTGFFSAARVSGRLRQLSPVLATGFGGLLILLALGAWFLIRQSDPNRPQIAQQIDNRNTTGTTTTPANSDDRSDQPKPDNQLNVNVSKNGAENLNHSKKPTILRKDPVKDSKNSTVTPVNRVPVQQLEQPQILMGDSSGQPSPSCVLQISGLTKTITIPLINGEKPIAVEIRMAGEQAPLQLVPVKTGNGHKNISVTFSTEKLETGKKYRVTLIQSDGKSRSSICEVKKSGP